MSWKLFHPDTELLIKVDDKEYRWRREKLALELGNEFMFVLLHKGYVVIGIDSSDDSIRLDSDYNSRLPRGILFPDKRTLKRLSREISDGSLCWFFHRGLIGTGEMLEGLPHKLYSDTDMIFRLSAGRKLLEVSIKDGTISMQKKYISFDERRCTNSFHV